MQTLAYPPSLYASGISAGFPFPADDYIDKRLGLNELMVPRPAATLFFWVRRSMAHYVVSCQGFSNGTPVD